MARRRGAVVASPPVPEVNPTPVLVQRHDFEAAAGARAFGLTRAGPLSHDGRDERRRVRFASVDEAGRFLRRLARRGLRWSTLRRCLAATMPATAVARLTEAELLDAFARGLVAGAVRVYAVALPDRALRLPEAEPGEAGAAPYVEAEAFFASAAGAVEFERFDAGASGAAEHETFDAGARGEAAHEGFDAGARGDAPCEAYAASFDGRGAAYEGDAEAQAAALRAASWRGDALCELPAGAERSG